jgi:hypothetical protein
MLPNESSALGMWEFPAAFTTLLLHSQHEEIHLIHEATQVIEIIEKNNKHNSTNIRPEFCF